MYTIFRSLITLNSWSLNPDPLEWLVAKLLSKVGYFSFVTLLSSIIISLFRDMPLHFAVNPSGLTKTPPPSQPSNSGAYYSSFHSTPERQKFSKLEWDKFTKESTKKALEELVSSPDFSKWAVANAERITLSPNEDTAVQPRRWLPWF